MSNREQQAAENAKTIESELQSLASVCNDSNFDVFWGKVKSVSGLFKTLKPLRQEDRDRLWAEFDVLCEDVKRRQAKVNEQAKGNADFIDGAIQSLASGHWAGMTQRDYRSFWAHAREISQIFKTTRPLRREDRERLWQRFHGICEETKERQRSENDNRRIRSKIHRDSILDDVERARPCSLFGFLPPDVAEMKALGHALKEAGQLLSKHKDEMLGEHKQECFERIQEVRSAQDAWWEELKGHRAQQHQDFQARVRANLEKNYEQLRRARDALSRARARADDLRDQISSAWSDGFRDRASGWLDEEEGRIRDIEAHIERIEGWIRENEVKLR